MNNKTEFINWWNQEMPDCVDTLILQMHGSPEALLFDLDGMKSSMKKDENGDLILTSRDMTAEEIKQKLNYKDINLMVNLCCDSLGTREQWLSGAYEEDSAKEKLTAYAIQGKGIRQQIASNGNVRVYNVDDEYFYASDGYLTIMESKNDYFYCLNGSTTQIDSSIYQFKADITKTQPYGEGSVENEMLYSLEDLIKNHSNPVE